MKTNHDKVSYLIGRQVAGNIVDQGLELNTEFLIQGIETGIKGEKCLISDAEAGEIMHSFQKQMTEKLEAEQKEFTEKNKKEGEDFLSKNGKKDDVTVTESGLQYKVINTGSGETPERSSTVEVHYEGTLIDGEVFDSSIERGQTAVFPVSGVIQGWQEVLQLMPVGSKWQVFIPYNLAYGEAGSPPKIGPCSALVFTIDLIDIK